MKLNPFRKQAERSFPEISMGQWLEQALGQFSYQGNSYSLPGAHQEQIADYTGYAQRAYASNGVVFACMDVRAKLFSEARFQFRNRKSGRAGTMFGTPDLAILEQPWVNGTTGDLLYRMIQHADLAGNAFAVTKPSNGDELALLRPDWVDIVIGSPNTDAHAWDPDAEVMGYVYHEGGRNSGRGVRTFLPELVAHWAPIPDPLARWRGMSWLTPVVREIMADKAATEHKLQFFENGAVTNMIVKFDVASVEKMRPWIELFRDGHEGSNNAYKTIFTAMGTDVTPVGLDFKQMDFKVTQGAGEPLALDTPVPTPDGWSTMGELEPGDFVFGRDGRPARVAAVSPVHLDRDCYRVTFSDRTSIVADGRHIWQVIDRNAAGNPRPETTKTTVEILAGIDDWHERGTSGNRYGVPAGRPVELDDRDLLVDPYVLGAWLGDGQTAGAAICGAQPDLDFIAAEIEARGYTVTRWQTKADKVAVIGIPGGLLAALDALGVLGNKHIPAEYLRASMTQRLDLLRGLMDTDGSVGSIGKESCEFSSKWEHLARQTAELARSLGYRVTVGSRRDDRSRTGEQWRVTFRADPDVIPFLLARKAARCVTPVWVKNRAIVSIEPVASVPVRCIAVETPDHLFRAGEGWTLTHNTRIAAAAGVPPVIVGLSEGLQAATYSNYSQARRRFADGTMRPLWRNLCGSLSSIVNVPQNAELWYDDRDIPALKEDIQDKAKEMQEMATAANQLVSAGFDPDSIVATLDAGDWSLLTHSGLVSVQLHPPGADTVQNPGADTVSPTPSTSNGSRSGALAALTEG